MKLVNFSLPTEQRRRVGVLTEDTVAELASNDLAGLLDLDSGKLASLRENWEGATIGQHELSRVKLHAPVERPGKIICVGLNYRDHCAEQNKPLPQSPILFAKYANAINAPHDPIFIPPMTQAVDYEAELAVVIGRRAKGVSETDALGYVAAYTIMNDVTARDFQRADGQFTRGKTQDGFAPLGPCLVTTDELGDAGQLKIQCWVNGELRQDSNTSNLVFGIAYLISYISQGITLEPGDLIATGTPGGVGEHRKPPTFLKVGDVVTIEIEKIGRIENPVVGLPVLGRNLL